MLNSTRAGPGPRTGGLPFTSWSVPGRPACLLSSCTALHGADTTTEERAEEDTETPKPRGRHDAPCQLAMCKGNSRASVERECRCHADRRPGRESLHWQESTSGRTKQRYKCATIHLTSPVHLTPPCCELGKAITAFANQNH